MFQSRNRGSFDFKGKDLSILKGIPLSFQSRNRGSFDFKKDSWKASNISDVFGFNLVIEVLLISSQITCYLEMFYIKFQSRNRGSFDFKCSSEWSDNGLFMFQSRNRGSFDFKLKEAKRLGWSCYQFQSRNRGSFDFKIPDPAGLDRFEIRLFQSRNRGSFDFKFNQQ